MKANFITTALWAVALYLGTIITSLANNHTIRNGEFWVVETNSTGNPYSIIRFYNDQHQIIYEEKLDGIFIDIRRPKNVRLLNKTLKGLTRNTLIASKFKKSKTLITSANVFN